MPSKAHRGFTLIELISVLVLVGILSVTLFSRLGNVHGASVHASRDDLIAALFFAQQQAMMRPGITLDISSNTISVNENGMPIKVSGDYYPLKMPSGVTLSPSTTFIYDKLGRSGREIPVDITLTGSGNSSGVAAKIRVEASGYAFAN
jgi:MSHA pilin protein MshC